MKRVFSKNRIILWCGWFGGVEFNELEFEKYKEARGFYIEDPWERVKTIFGKDGYGAWHPELVQVMQRTQIGAFAGVIYGGMIYGLKGQETFKRTTETDIFANKKQAYRANFNYATLSFGKGALIYAPRFAFFCGSFSFLSSCGALYRNKHGIIENTLAGFLTGALCKFSFGIKGFVSGGIFGGLIGTIYGITVWSLEKVFKKDQLQVKYMYIAYNQNKKRLQNSIVEKDPEIRPLEALHVSHVNNPLDSFEVEKK